MKITRFVFIFVLLASVIFVPTKMAYAQAPSGAINIEMNGAPSFVNGQLTYHFRVTYSIEPTATENYDARVVVTFQHPQVIDTITVTDAGGQTVNADAAAGTVTIPSVMMVVGTGPNVLEFDVTYDALPVGSLPLNTSVTAQITNNDNVGSLPESDELAFTVGASAIMVNLTATPALVPVGGTVTYTVTVSTTADTVLPVHARVAIQFAQSDLTAGVIGQLAAQAPVVVDNVNKIVTWDGQLAPAGTLPETFTFTVKAAYLPGGVTSTYTAHATATASDFNNPGSLPVVTDTEPFTIQAMRILMPILYKTVN